MQSSYHKSKPKRSFCTVIDSDGSSSSEDDLDFESSHNLDFKLAKQITKCSNEALLELVLDKSEKEAFNVVKNSVRIFSKFKFLYDHLVEKFELTQNNYALFKCAFLNGNKNVIEFLLQNNYNVPECLDFALGSIVLLECVSRDLNGLLELILEFGVDVTKNDNCAICTITEAYDKDLVLFKLLEKNGADITARSNYPIKKAAALGNTELVWYLIKQGVDFRTDSDYVLRKCSFYGNYELVEFLLKAGADTKTFTKKNIVTLIKSAKFEIIKLLLDYGLDLTVIKESDIVFENNLRKNNSFKNQIIEKYNLLVGKNNMDPLILLLLLIRSSEKL